ncbi:MAG: hypothetical protein ACM3Q4_04695 [Acidobacteriota bacterium]
MEKHSSRFYDLRFGILIAIIIMILLFKLFGSQSSSSVPPASSAPAPAQHAGSDTLSLLR